MNNILNIKTIGQLYQMVKNEKPKHPLVSIMDYSKIVLDEAFYGQEFTLDFYSISLKGSECGMTYGRKHYDFEEGVMIFTAPNQVMAVEPNDNDDKSGWALYFHPDLIRGSELGRKMKQYTFFAYNQTEALHLSDAEKNLINTCITNIEYEYNQTIDNHSQTLLINNIELLLNYCLRFFERQFNTRTNLHKGVVKQFDDILSDYFSSNDLTEKGLPSVQNIADQVFLSANYLSDLLKKETGKTAQEHIHLRLINKAKDLLLTTNLSVKEIAYDLGFDYPHYFSRVFKSKTGKTPVAFRNLNT